MRNYIQNIIYFRNELRTLSIIQFCSEYFDCALVNAIHENEEKPYFCSKLSLAISTMQWKLLISLKICLGADFVYMFLRILFNI